MSTVVAVRFCVGFRASGFRPLRIFMHKQTGGFHELVLTEQLIGRLVGKRLRGDAGKRTERVGNSCCGRTKCWLLSRCAQVEQARHSCHSLTWCDVRISIGYRVVSIKRVFRTRFPFPGIMLREIVLRSLGRTMSGTRNVFVRRILAHQALARKLLSRSTLARNSIARNSIARKVLVRPIFVPSVSFRNALFCRLSVR